MLANTFTTTFDATYCPLRAGARTKCGCGAARLHSRSVSGLVRQLVFASRGGCHFAHTALLAMPDHLPFWKFDLGQGGQGVYDYIERMVRAVRFSRVPSPTLRVG